MFEVMNTQNTTGQIRTLIGTSKYRRCIIITYKAIRKLLKYGTIFFTMTIQISIYNFY